MFVMDSNMTALAAEKKMKEVKKKEEEAKKMKEAKSMRLWRTTTREIEEMEKGAEEFFQKV